MNALRILNARVVTPARGPQRGEAIGQLKVLPQADVLIEDGVIKSVTPRTDAVPATPQSSPARTIDAAGRVLMPAFVDCHTHACWAGSRLDEWEMRLRGATYQEIMAAGGGGGLGAGIMATVRAVRAASEVELAEGLEERLEEFLRGGTTTVEVKSGYGLTTRDEVKMLRAIARAAERWPGTVVLTALLGHAMDPHLDPHDFVRKTIHETLPTVHAEFPGIAVDAYLEKGAWSLDDTRKLLSAARGLGHPVRLHADQFTSMGGIPLAIELAAASVDHLEAGTPQELAALGASPVVGVGLPVCGLHLDGRYAHLRSVIDAGGAVAIATNCNPGSAPTTSMPLAAALAVRHPSTHGLTPAEAITAITTNAAAVLGLNDRGTIESGLRADLVLLKHPDERMLTCELGGSPVAHVICGGLLM
ncbi:imidazolonepropionase [Phycisphaerales bacterium]|nr:imidazolonepropionase [Phycisphaerales bacterium]